jgi:hypothetical protein
LRKRSVSGKGPPAGQRLRLSDYHGGLAGPCRGHRGVPGLAARTCPRRSPASYSSRCDYRLAVRLAEVLVLREGGQLSRAGAPPDACRLCHFCERKTPPPRGGVG